MQTFYAALRFEGDKNLWDKLYWYRSDFPVSEGEEVFAPVGMRDRIQKARVEKVLKKGEPAPYEEQLLKAIAAPVARAQEGIRDFGGHKIDDRHYTRFGKVFLCPSPEMLPATYAHIMQFEASMSEMRAVICAILKGERVVLYGEEGRRFMKELLQFLRGDGGIPEALALSERELAVLFSRLA